jgi:hypothetical protein
MSIVVKLGSLVAIVIQSESRTFQSYSVEPVTSAIQSTSTSAESLGHVHCACVVDDLKFELKCGWGGQTGHNKHAVPHGI